MANRHYKWQDRAERYIELLENKDIDGAEHYLMQFKRKIGRMLEAIWDLECLRVEREESYQREIRVCAQEEKGTFEQV